MILTPLEIDKSGIVKDDAFFTILKLHDIHLSEDEIKRLKMNHCKHGKINFAEALRSVNINLDAAVLKEERWQVANVDGKFEGCEPSQASKAVSHLSRLNVEEFNAR